MGHQIDAGEQGVYFTDGAWLVSGWCERAAPREKPPSMSERDWMEAQMGTTYHSADAVRLADSQVPHSFARAKELGFLDGHFRAEIDEDAFRQCREFLSYAARQGHDISGSH